jgi:hypothetical protein
MQTATANTTTKGKVKHIINQQWNRLIFCDDVDV